MNDLHRENIARVTRRQLFGSAASGVGMAALASLMGNGPARGRRPAEGRVRAAGLAPFRPEGQAGRRPLARGRAFARGPVRPQAGDAGDGREGHPRQRARDDPALDHVERLRQVADPARDQAVQEVRPGRHRDERDAPERGSDRRRDLPGSEHVHRGREPRARRDVLHDGCAGPGPAQHGGLAVVRARQRDRQPADVRRDDLERQGQDLRPVVLRLLLGQRVPAQPVPGRPVPEHGRPRAVPREPAGGEPRRAAGLARRHGGA